MVVAHCHLVKFSLCGLHCCRCLLLPGSQFCHSLPSFALLVFFTLATATSLKNIFCRLHCWGNFTLYLGHFPNTYCFTSPTMCVISPTILLHFPNNFASFPQQYGSFPQQYGSLPQQYESFPQLVFSFPQQFCVTFPNPQKQISPPKKAFFTNLRAIYHVKVPPPQPPFHVFSTISC